MDLCQAKKAVNFHAEEVTELFSHIRASLEIFDNCHRECSPVWPEQGCGCDGELLCKFRELFLRSALVNPQMEIAEAHGKMSKKPERLISSILSYLLHYMPRRRHRGLDDRGTPVDVRE